MSDEPKDGGWTLTSLREHIAQLLAADQRRQDERVRESDIRYTARFEAQEKAVRAAHDAQREALEKVDRANEKRFEGVNEFRAQLSDQAQTFLPRREADAKIEALAEKLDQLTTRVDKAEGRGIGLTGAWVYALGAIAALGTVVSLYLALRR